MNLFEKTEVETCQEDRVTNALLYFLNTFRRDVLSEFLLLFGLKLSPDLLNAVDIRNQVAVGGDARLDGAFSIENELFVAMETKIFRNMLVEPIQLEKYIGYVANRPERQKYVFVVSPDYVCPGIFDSLRKKAVDVRWASWIQVGSFMQEMREQFAENPVLNFLFREYLEYLDALGLRETGPRNHPLHYEPLLGAILGNATMEKTLIHLCKFTEVNANRIGRDWGLGTSQIQKQLKRLEKGGLVRKKRAGRTVLYSLDNDSEIVQQLRSLVGVALEKASLPW